MILFFRLIIAALALLSFYTGYLGFRYGAVNSYYGFPDYPLYTHGSVILDSNFRFYNGLWFGVGLLLCWVFINARKRSNVMILLSVLFVSGATGRLVSLLTCGAPSIMYAFFLPFEFGFPLLALWQRKLSCSDL